MHFVGVDLHKRFLVACAEDERGAPVASARFDCQDREDILEFFEKVRPFRVVIEASCSYRWFHDAVAPLGEVVLAHPLQLRAIVAGRAKTDKLDAALLARLLRAGLIPEAYIPPPEYQELRDIARARARLSRQGVAAVNELQSLLCRRNIRLPFANLSSMRSRRWVAGLDLGLVDGFLRDELLRRLEHYQEELVKLDALLHGLASRFPQTEALTVLHGIGLYSALLIVAEIGEPSRFAEGRQVGAYAGLTARVSQSGEHAYYGHISHQGSPWLRWILVEAAMKLVFRDRQLGNFYQRLRKRSGAKIARVAAARKLAVICWKRLMRWQRSQAA